uniref:Uncharacterized protein n=1 Tax=Triticum urartu TaxID=4572 RepID=A0A8R7QQV2_TRIUA
MRSTSGRISCSVSAVAALETVLIPCSERSTFSSPRTRSTKLLNILRFSQALHEVVSYCRIGIPTNTGCAPPKQSRQLALHHRSGMMHGIGTVIDESDPAMCSHSRDIRVHACAGPVCPVPTKAKQ